jgi:zinc finger protein
LYSSYRRFSAEGTIYTASILSRKDLDRQIVRSASCTISIPEYELTLPANRGQLTTVEGLIRDIVADLSIDQPLRRIQDETAYLQIQSFIEKLKEIFIDNRDEDGNQTVPENAIPMPTFTVKLDDPAGNSFIEFIGSMADPKWSLRTYPRTRQQNIDLGLSVPDDPDVKNDIVQTEDHVGSAQEAVTQASDSANEEIYVFPGVCSSCSHPLNTLMQKVVIPHFKAREMLDLQLALICNVQDVFIMSTNCDECGYRDNEVKSGSAIPEKGKRITLKVEDLEDLSRDILKATQSQSFYLPALTNFFVE